MTEENPAVFHITDPLSTRNGHTLGGKFVNISRMALYAYRPKSTNAKNEPSKCNNNDAVQVHFLQRECIFNDPILRSLVAESASIFIALKSLKKQSCKEDYVTISRTYRSVIRACLVKLQDATLNTKSEDSDKCTLYKHYISIFYSIECVWHLIEILLLDSTNKRDVVTQLLEWVRFHFPSAERIATDLLLQNQNAVDNEHYWPTLRGLIIHGQIEVTRALLNLHPKAESPPFKLVEQILKNMPTYNSIGGFSLQKFRSQWQYWLNDTLHKLSTNILEVEPALEELIKLITGDTDLWNSHIRNSQHWYELMPGFLYYTNRTCKHFELSNAALGWLQRWSSLQNKVDQNFKLTYLDKFILSVMDNDIEEIIISIHLMSDSQWFATHLIDLLYSSGQLKISRKHYFKTITKLHDSLLFQYGSKLMSYNSLWQFGIDYLEHCTAGTAALELLLARVPIKTERCALNILHICSKKSLYKPREEICKIQARKSLTEKRYGNALEWAIRSNDSLYVTTIADYILKHYVQTGDILCADVLVDIGAKMFISPRLIFLVKYLDFHELYRKKKFPASVQLFINLLESKITPEYFWPSLFLDCIPLMESKDIKMFSEETCCILHHVETDLIPMIEKTKKYLEKHPEDSVNILKDYRLDNVEDFVNLLRLTCARNLSRAIITENTMMNEITLPK